MIALLVFRFLGRKGYIYIMVAPYIHVIEYVLCYKYLHVYLTYRNILLIRSVWRCSDSDIEV